PESLRRQYSEGYRVEIELPPQSIQPVAATISRLGYRGEPNGAGVSFAAQALDAALLAELQKISTEIGGARVHIRQSEMTDVFRRVLLESNAVHHDEEKAA